MCVNLAREKTRKSIKTSSQNSREKLGMCPSSLRADSPCESAQGELELAIDRATEGSGEEDTTRPNTIAPK
eukprot:2309247-Rhodomonas_salina.2